MGQEVRDQEILRRLAIVDEGLASAQAGLGRAPPGAWVLDPAAAAPVRVEALAAVGAPEACLEWTSNRALAEGATEDEITGALLAIIPAIGLGRVADAVPGVAGAFEYDIWAALEDRDDP